MLLCHCPPLGALTHKACPTLEFLLLLCPWNPEHPCTKGLQFAPPLSWLTQSLPRWLCPAVGPYLVHTGSDSCVGAVESLRGECMMFLDQSPWASSNPTGLHFHPLACPSSSLVVPKLLSPKITWETQFLLLFRTELYLSPRYLSKVSVLKGGCGRLPAFPTCSSFSHLKPFRTQRQEGIPASRWQHTSHIPTLLEDLTKKAAAVALAQMARVQH